jgi:formylglycine-generating enzyme required for sulfatase activity
MMSPIFQRRWARFCGQAMLVALGIGLLSCSTIRADFGIWPNGQETERGLGLPTLKTLPSSAKRYALVIGVDKYQDTQITTLGGATNDARTIADALVRYAGFPADQVILLSSDQPAERQPTRGNIIRRLSNLRSLIPPDGLLFISFAGHGIERQGKAYLLPADAQVSDDITVLEDTAVSVISVKERIKQTGVKQVMVVLDACRNDPSGRADAPNPLTESYTRGFNFDTRNQELTAFATFYATDVGLRAYEYTEKKQGYFTWALVEGLKGAAANEKGEVTLATLRRYLEEIVPKRVKLDLGTGKEQRPRIVVEGYRADDLVISVNINVNVTINDTTNPKTNTAEAAAPAANGVTFSFKTVTISMSGKVLKEATGQARYLTEKLGDGVGLEMVEIPAGKFLMGSDFYQRRYRDDKYEGPEDPIHEVNVPSFYLGKFEVTQAQWRAVAKLPMVKIPLKPDPSHFKFEELPVENILWDEAKEFCARLSRLTGKTYRLPTEAEWEYACRAGTTGDFHFGGITTTYANYNNPANPDVTRDETNRVGELKFANAFGLYDMHGNVWEFCEDSAHENYKGAPVDGSAWRGGDETKRMARGGAWITYPETCRSAYRNPVELTFKRSDYGFRVVLEKSTAK